MIDLLKQIPVTFYIAFLTALFTSVATLSGVFITNKANKDGDITKGLLTLKYKNTTYDINYEIEKNITMSDYNFDKALSIKSIDEIDMAKINEAIEVISNSNLIKNLSNILQELSY